MDQGSTMKRSAVHNFAPTVTKFCVMWEGQALPHDTKFGNSRCEIVGRRVIFIWSLIHGLRWSGLIKAEPGQSLSPPLTSITAGSNACRRITDKSFSSLSCWCWRRIGQENVVYLISQFNCPFMLKSSRRVTSLGPYLQHKQVCDYQLFEATLL